MRPQLKVPVNAARIREAKELLKQNKGKEAAAALREVRQSLERFESRLTGTWKK
jgi:predicted component of type VI protein secretion system